MGTDRRKAVAIGLIFSFAALAGCGGGSEGSRSGASGSAVAPPTTGPWATWNKTPTPTGPTKGSAYPSGDGSATAADAAKPLTGKVIVIDPGHNGRNAAHPEVINRQVDVGNGRKECDTTGTETRAGYAEHAFTWDVSTRLAKLLAAQGAKVVLTRANDKGVGPCITERAAIGNKAEADAAISIHADGAGSGDHGFHIIRPLAVPGYNSSIVGDSKDLAYSIRKAFRDGTGLPYSTYRGDDAIDARDDLGGLNLSTVPKIFIECGNMRNSGDAAKLSDAAFRERIAKAIAAGLDDHLR